MFSDVSDLEKKIIQTDEKVTLHGDQIEADWMESLKHSEECTKTLIEESIASNGNTLQERDREMDRKVKYLEEKINQNSERNTKVTGEISKTVQEFSHLQTEQLRNLKSELELKLKEQNQQNESEISSLEDCLTVETTNKISHLGMLFIKNVITKISISTL